MLSIGDLDMTTKLIPKVEQENKYYLYSYKSRSIKCPNARSKYIELRISISRFRTSILSESTKFKSLASVGGATTTYLSRSRTLKHEGMRLTNTGTGAQELQSSPKWYISFFPCFSLSRRFKVGDLTLFPVTYSFAALEFPGRT